jgi:hypothetical protein
MLEPPMPRKFCREFAEFGCNQLGLIMATALNLKPLMDVWIPNDRYGVFNAICGKYGLHVKPNSIIIQPTPEEIKATYGKNMLYRESTTKSIAVPFGKASLARRGEVHAFITRKPERFDKALRYGWYSWVVDGRLIAQPLIHAARFGEALGYPDCCIEFYTKNRRPDIPLYHKRLEKTRKAPSYSYVHHTSCSLDCEATIQQAQKIENAIKEREPEYSSRIKKALKMPLIVYGERNAYVFDGVRDGNTIRYKDCEYLGEAPDDQYGAHYKQGNIAIVEDHRIRVFRDKRLISTISKDSPKFGFLLQFV